jgi:hypothetical protein
MHHRTRRPRPSVPLVVRIAAHLRLILCTGPLAYRSACPFCPPSARRTLVFRQGAASNPGAYSCHACGRTGDLGDLLARVVRPGRA